MQRSEAKMWKKKDDATGALPGFPSTQTEPTLESLSDGLDDAYRERYAEKEKPAPATTTSSFFADNQPHPPVGTVSTYTDAVNEFTKAATAFIEQVPLLTKALDAYEQAARLSAELRKVLDMGDESLRTLMSPLEQVINLRAVRTASDKKRPEPARVEPIRQLEERRLAQSQSYGQGS
jgi:hypothetical protein